MEQKNLFDEVKKLKALFPNNTIFLSDLENTCVDYLYYAKEFISLSADAENGTNIDYFSAKDLKQKNPEDFKDLSDELEFYYFKFGQDEMRRSLENALHRAATFRDRVSQHINSWSGLYLGEEDVRPIILKRSLRVIVNTPSFVTAIELMFADKKPLKRLGGLRNTYTHQMSPEFRISRNKNGSFSITVQDSKNIFTPIKLNHLDISKDLLHALQQMAEVISLLSSGIEELRTKKII